MGTRPSDNPKLKFLAPGGEMAERIAAYDWAATALGPIAAWPDCLKHTISLMLPSPVPLVLLWGHAGVMIYNDAYAEFAGARDNRLLGSDVREGWDEVADFNDHVMRVGLGGGTLSYRDHELTLHRNGRAEQVFMNLDYSPVRDEAGEPVGVLAVVVETTAIWEARRALEENARKLRFLDELGRSVAESNSAAEILAITTRMTGEHLGLSNCAYADMDEDQDGFTIRGNWHKDSAPTILGHYSLAAFGTQAVIELHAGRPLIVNDNLAELLPHEATTFRDIGISATICMPLVKSGRLTALMAIHDDAPRNWSEYDLDVISEVTSRSWAHIERAASEAEQRASATALQDLNATLEQRIDERTRQLLEVEEVLRQSQKMEAVGQMTGGLAHDFNNLLGAISGSLELIQSRIDQGRAAETGKYLTAAAEAVARAASLTHRLLAFARRQTLEAKPTDANRLIGELEELIRRTVGPEISLVTEPERELWATLVDRNQLENVVLNLCINARDAMPDGGDLLVRTANVTIDGQEAAVRGIPAGDYVRLAVSDSGTGMSSDTIAHAFDPFFTTKPIGQGTGLGLSMVYGFVRQSGGDVKLHSREGEGTTVELIFPRHDRDAEALAEPAATAGASPGHAARGADKTILVVDDELLIRMMMTDALEEAGYNVLEAVDGATALAALRGDEAIDLLISDVGLPNGMNGRQLADAARELRPALPTLFVTGYAQHAVLNEGDLERAMAVITKPFSIQDLLDRTHAMLVAAKV